MLFNILERHFAGTIVGEYYTLGASIVYLCNISESLLACSIPELELHYFAVDLMVLYLEVHAYSIGACFGELLLAKLLYEGSLAHSRVAKHDGFDHDVERMRFHYL